MNCKLTRDRHCEGPLPTDAPETTSSAAESEPTITEEHEDDHEHTEDPGPSPTESVGCEPHGDHWYVHVYPTPNSSKTLTVDLGHCEGPAVTSSDLSTIIVPTPTGNGTAPTNPPEAGAGGVSAGIGAVAVAGVFALMAI
jgi:hypothetical protein